MAFEVKRKTSRSKAALSRAEEQDSKSAGKNNTKHHGRYYVPVPKPIGRASLPTFQEWVEQRARLEGRK